MQTSARNQLSGTVTAVHHGPINAEVELDIGRAQKLVAVITRQSVERLGLVPGSVAVALIKASWPILVAGRPPVTSARNQLCGTVTAVHRGAVDAEIELQLDGGATLAVIITNTSEERLGLKAGDAACALVKASHVILAIE